MATCGVCQSPFPLPIAVRWLSSPVVLPLSDSSPCGWVSRQHKALPGPALSLTLLPEPSDLADEERAWRFKGWMGQEPSDGRKRHSPAKEQGVRQLFSYICLWRPPLHRSFGHQIPSTHPLLVSSQSNEAKRPIHSQVGKKTKPNKSWVPSCSIHQNKFQPDQRFKHKKWSQTAKT